jgi:hypothetical protein
LKPLGCRLSKQPATQDHSKFKTSKHIYNKLILPTDLISNVRIKFGDITVKHLSKLGLISWKFRFKEEFCIVTNLE